MHVIACGLDCICLLWLLVAYGFPSPMPLSHFAFCCCIVPWLWLGYMWWLPLTQPILLLLLCLFSSVIGLLLCVYGWWAIPLRSNMHVIACGSSRICSLWLLVAYGCPSPMPLCHLAFCCCAVLWSGYSGWPWLPLSQTLFVVVSLLICYWPSLMCVWMMSLWNSLSAMSLCLGFAVAPSLIYVCVYISPVASLWWARWSNA